VTHGWSPTTLEQVLLLNRSGFWGQPAPIGQNTVAAKVIRNGDISRDGSLRGFAERHLTPNEAASSRLIPGDVVLTTSGEVGKTWLVDDTTGLFASNFVRILRPDTKKILPSFLRYALDTGPVIASLRANTSGTTISNLGKGFYQTAIFPLPPLADQARVVSFLDEALAAVRKAQANTEQNLRNARALLQGVLDRAFAQHGPGWAEKPLAECLQLITYGFTNPMPTTVEGPYMITAKNVVGGRIDFASARRTSRDAFDRLLTDKSRPQVGDVLLTKDGTLGRLAVVDRTDVCINQSVALLRPNERMGPHFMRYLLSSSGYQRRMVEDAGGTTIKHIYITRVDKMGVVFPQSTQEQQDIVAKLDALTLEAQRLAGVCERKMGAVDGLRQSVLERAFAGAL
jgi:type I restriction enzyme, S subunit